MAPVLVCEVLIVRGMSFLGWGKKRGGGGLVERGREEG